MAKKHPRKRSTRATLKNPPQWLYNALCGHGATASGVNVSETTALNLSVVWACVRVISETIASLPWLTYEKQSDGGRNRAERHEIYSLLHDQPNPDMTAFTWKETAVAHGLTWGNSFSEIIREQSGEIVALYPITPERVTPKRRANGEIFYTVTQGSAPDAVLESDEMFHVPGLGFDGIVGYSVIHKARESLGLTVAAEMMGAAFFGNGAHSGGALEHPGKLSPQAADRLRESFEAKHRGASKAGKVVVLEEGMKFNKTSIPNTDAQFLETRQFQVDEICRWFRVQPHKVANLAKATFSNIEHQSIEFVTDTIRPWLIRFEQEANRKLLRPRDRGKVYTEFLVDALLRGDALSRSQALQVQFQNGIITIDEWRGMENRNPVAGGEGKKHFVTQQQVPLDKIDQLADAKAAPKAGPVNPARDAVERHLAGVREQLGDAAAEREAIRLAGLIRSNLDG